MPIRNPFTQLINLYQKPATVSADVLKQKLSPEDRKLIQRIGTTLAEIKKDVDLDVQINYDRQSLARELNRCISGNTKIWLLDNTTPSVKEMFENREKYIGRYTLSINPTTLGIEPDKITNIQKTRLNTQLVRVYIDSDDKENNYIDCTPDHKFLCRNGEYKEAQHLQPGDSLMPFYTKFHKRGLSQYLGVYDPQDNKWPYIHQLVAKAMFGHRNNKGIVIHHKDFLTNPNSKLNNDPSNLKLMESSKHKSLHSKHTKHRPNCDCIFCKNGKGELKGENSFNYGREPWNKNLTKETDERLKKVSEKGTIVKCFRTKFCKCGCGGQFKEDSRYPQDYIWGHNTKFPKEKRSCPICGTKFECRNNSDKKFCSKKCSNESLKKRNKVNCLYCGKQFEVCLCEDRKYCSKDCSSKDRKRNGWKPEKAWKARKGQENWNIGLTKETDERIARVAIKISQALSGKKKTLEHVQNIVKSRKGNRQKALLVESLLNHRVVKVQWLKEKEDTYDLTIERNHNFPTAVGVFVHNCISHWLMGSAIRLYSTYATPVSSIHNRTVWITSDSSEYQRVLTKLLNDIGIEEKIYDWAWTVGAFGDLFVEIEGVPDLGIISIDDKKHPIQMSRIDHKGVLVGFYETPIGISGSERKIIPPWDWVHFRLLGATVKRPIWGDPSYQEFRSIHLMTQTTTQLLTSRYGSSLLLDGLPSYKRLRLAEDSILLARKTRSVLRYIYLLKCGQNSYEAISEVVEEISNLLKTARALNTSQNSPYFDSKSDELGVSEDLFLPLIGEMDVKIEEIGGKVDIKWIADIEELRNQLACSLSVPLPLLGGYTKEASGALGSEAISQLDRCFGKNTKRLQRAIKEGIKRLCQIHLAYLNMDPDPALFEVNMAETSTVEEESLKASLDIGTDVIKKVMETLEEFGDIEKKEVFNYLNKKILKLEDFDLDRFLKTNDQVMEPKKESKKNEKEIYPISNTDFLAFLPMTNKILNTRNQHKLNEGSEILFTKRLEEDWKKMYGHLTIVETKFNEKPTIEGTQLELSLES